MSNSIAARLGKNIAAVRKASGKTQAEIAEKVEIDTVSLSRIERGIVCPSIATLDRIAKVLDKPLGRLFDLDVLDEKGVKLDRADFGKEERGCIVCGAVGRGCASASGRRSSSRCAERSSRSPSLS